MSGEPHYLSLRDLAYWQSRKTHKSPAGTRPTLGELQRGHPWTWLWCERCQHHAPFAFAAAVMRWGPDASSDVLRQRARCTACGNLGATLQHPSWGATASGFCHFRLTSDNGRHRCQAIRGCGGLGDANHFAASPVQGLNSVSRRMSRRGCDPKAGALEADAFYDW